MRAVLVAAALLVAGCGASGPGSTSPGVAPSPQAPAPTALRVVSSEAISDRLHDYRVDSPAMARTLGIRVLLPKSYASGARYPVLYLLHGGLQPETFQAWTLNTDLEAFTEGLDVIVVMPEAGQMSWYMDYYNHGLGGPPRWETFIVREVVEWTDATFRTRAQRNARLVAGLSMGGYGSGKFLTRFPDVFGAGAIYSAITQMAWNLGFQYNALGAAFESDPTKEIWGAPMVEEMTYLAHSPLDLAENLLDSYVEIRSGDGMDGAMTSDYSEAAADDQALLLADRLETLGVRHGVRIEAGGTHTWPFWEEYLHETLPLLLEHSRTAPATPPATFTYVSGESAFTIYDWRVEMQRTVREFVRLENVSRSGFEIIGSGVARITTPAFFAPGSAHDVNGESVAADAQGRLTFDVTIAPDHAFEQFSPGYTLSMPGADYMTRRAVEIR